MKPVLGVMMALVTAIGVGLGAHAETYDVSTVGELTAALAKQADGDVINIAKGNWRLRQDSVAVNVEAIAKPCPRGRRRVVLGKIDLGCYEHPFSGLTIIVR